MKHFDELQLMVQLTHAGLKLLETVNRGLEKEFRGERNRGVHEEKEGRDRGEEFIWPGL